MFAPKKRILYFAVLFTLVALACSIPGLSGVDNLPVLLKHSIVSNVKAEVDETGIVHVAVEYKRGSEKQATLVCSYPGEDGASSLQHTYIDSEPATDSSFITYHEFAFLVKKPGSYTATCAFGEYSSSGSFTIPQPAATPTDDLAAPGAFELPKPGQFTSAGMWFYFDTATRSVENYFLEHCLPGVNYNDQGGSDYFSVAQDGTLTGECQFAYGSSLILTGKIAEGKWTEDGKVTFRLETQAVSNSSSPDKPGTSTNDVVWLGVGQFTSATSATGMATWTGICTTTNPDWVPCVKAEYGSYLEAKGTIQWIINFGP
jgi:hypothetical protein